MAAELKKWHVARTFSGEADFVVRAHVAEIVEGRLSFLIHDGPGFEVVAAFELGAWQSFCEELSEAQPVDLRINTELVDRYQRAETARPSFETPDFIRVQESKSRCQGAAIACKVTIRQEFRDNCTRDPLGHETPDGGYAHYAVWIDYGLERKTLGIWQDGQTAHAVALGAAMAANRMTPKDPVLQHMRFEPEKLRFEIMCGEELRNAV